MNYFSLFNIKQEFNIDLHLLNQRYIDMLAEYHPDKLNADNTGLRLIDSVLINAAYTTLKSDILRAEYLLSLYDIHVCHIDASDNSNLEEIWAIWELISTTNDASILEKLYAERSANKDRLIEKLEKAFLDHHLEEALDLTMKLKYHTNVINSIKTQLNYVLCKN